MAKRRDIDAELPRYPVVTPEGIIKLVACANNVTGALELDEDGTPAVVRSHVKKGWILLQDLYQQEGRMELWKAWADHQAARMRARKDGQKIPAFPEQYLPAEVQRRRAGHRPLAHTWSMPTFEPVSLDAPAPVGRGPGRPRKE